MDIDVEHSVTMIFRVLDAGTSREQCAETQAFYRYAGAIPFAAVHRRSAG